MPKPEKQFEEMTPEQEKRASEAISEMMGIPLETPKHSGFEAPAIGIVMPKGTRFKKLPNGRITAILPDDDPNGNRT